MRPLKLRISAFGPYAGNVELNLEKLGTNGIYLITGDTGAGKTTIFDAIMYALFGTPSGDNRDATMLRSKYAQPDTPTEVELTFINGDKEYTVKRNPEYQRPSKRGDKLTSQKAEAMLTLPDGNIVTKPKEVNAAIRDILGVDREQFSQISMIAQGDFMKLLVAETKDRQKIFREIFDTKYYQILQERLKNESGTLSRKFDEAKLSVNQYIKGILCNPDDVLSFEVEKAKSGNMMITDVMELIAVLIKKDETTSQNIQEEIIVLENQLEKVNKELTKAENYAKAENDLAHTIKEYAEKLSLVEDLKEKVNELKSRQPEIDLKQKQIGEVEAQYSLYDELLMKQKTVDELLINRDKNKKRIETAQVKIDGLKETIVRLKEEQATFIDIAVQKEKFTYQKEEAEAKKKKIEIFQTRLIAFNRQKEILRRAQDDYCRANEIAEKTAENYHFLNKLFLDSQAGILADMLREGEPCPVCGSIEHPNRAVKPTEIPTETQLKSAKKRVDETAKDAALFSRKAGELLGKVSAEQESLLNESGDLLNVEALSDAYTKSEEILALLKNSILQLHTKIDEMNRMIQRKEWIEKQIPSQEAELERVNQILADTEKNMVSDEATLKENKIQMDSISQKLKYRSKAEAKAVLDNLKKEIANQNKLFETAENRYRVMENSINELKGRQEQLKMFLDGKENVDKEQLTKDKQMLLEKRGLLSERQKQLAVRMDANVRAKSNIAVRAEELTLIEEKWTWVKALSNTANGNISGKEKIMLETYVQSTFFERIIQRANTRLMVMSDGQYELRRRKVASDYRGQSGLELDVKDYYNGSVRDVKSLSGGESFKASLSLALGLSDEVQSMAGGIRLETMFVDEGFGSLDGDSLQQAIRALTSLADGNRLVGIISHVAELKEKIDKQIVVKKDKTCGSRVEIVV